MYLKRFFENKCSLCETFGGVEIMVASHDREHGRLELPDAVGSSDDPVAGEHCTTADMSCLGTRHQLQ